MGGIDHIYKQRADLSLFSYKNKENLMRYLGYVSVNIDLIKTKTLENRLCIVLT